MSMTEMALSHCSCSGAMPIAVIPGWGILCVTYSMRRLIERGTVHYRNEP